MDYCNFQDIIHFFIPLELFQLENLNRIKNMYHK